VLWSILALIAVLWPSHISGILDGAPLDRLSESVLLGLFVPVLAWFDPSFLRYRLARLAIAAILLVKIAAIVAIQQQGWWITFTPPRPMVRDSTGKPHAWDIRADWLSEDPVCSAVLTDRYRDSFEVPAWFFNLPPPDDAVVRTGFHPGEIPIRIAGTGYLSVRGKGTFELLTTAPMAVSVRIDGIAIPAASPGEHRTELPRGTHLVQFEGTMIGKLWRVVPRWNGAAMGSMFFPLATLAPASAVDRIAAPAFNWIVLLLVIALLAAWTVSTVVRVRAPALWVCAGGAIAAIVIAEVYMP